MEKEIFEKEIGKQLENNFGLWAFGEGFQNKQSIELLESWNKAHGDILPIESNETIELSAVKMVTLWRKEKGIQ